MRRFLKLIAAHGYFAVGGFMFGTVQSLFENQDPMRVLFKALGTFMAFGAVVITRKYLKSTVDREAVKKVAMVIHSSHAWQQVELENRLPVDVLELAFVALIEAWIKSGRKRVMTFENGIEKAIIEAYNRLSAW